MQSKTTPQQQALNKLNPQKINTYIHRRVMKFHKHKKKKKPTFSKGICIWNKVSLGVRRAVSNSSAENSNEIFKRGLNSCRKAQHFSIQKTQWKKKRSINKVEMIGHWGKKLDQMSSCQWTPPSNLWQTRQFHYSAASRLGLGSVALCLFKLHFLTLTLS